MSLTNDKTGTVTNLTFIIANEGKQLDFIQTDQGAVVTGTATQQGPAGAQAAATAQ